MKLHIFDALQNGSGRVRFVGGKMLPDSLQMIPHRSRILRDQQAGESEPRVVGFDVAGTQGLKVTFEQLFCLGLGFVSASLGFQTFNQAVADPKDVVGWSPLAQTDGKGLLEKVEGHRRIIPLKTDGFPKIVLGLGKASRRDAGVAGGHGGGRLAGRGWGFRNADGTAPGAGLRGPIASGRSIQLRF